MIITAILVAAAILAANIVQFTNYVDGKIEENLDEAVHEMMNEIEMMKAMSYTAALYFVNDNELIAAMKNGGREAILKRASVMYKETGVEMCVITDNRGVAVARPHAPNNYGDDLMKMPCVRTALSGQILTTIERGITVGISTNTGAPVYDKEGHMLGMIVIGYRLDRNEFVDKLKSMSGCEHTVFVDNMRAATTIIDDNGKRPVGTRAPDAISQAVLTSEGITGQFKVLGKDMTTKYIPLYNNLNQIQGMLFAGRFMTEKTNTVQEFITTGILLTAIILGIGVFIIKVSTPIISVIDRAYHDGLTGVYNRRYFDENITHSIASLSRSKGVLSLMMIDIDFFKKYNDTYGHIEGDHCLRAIAETLSKSMPRTDDFVARYGGEEFVVVLPNTDENGARVVADKILGNIRNLGIPHEKNTAADCVTVSIGVTTGAVSHTQTGDDYVKKADEILYASKQNGRNRYTFEKMDSYKRASEIIKAKSRNKVKISAKRA
jgi:diguanylate cyclase (GGDEF)-like protein